MRLKQKRDVSCRSVVFSIKLACGYVFKPTLLYGGMLKRTSNRKLNTYRVLP